MEVNKAGKDLIKQFEGCKLKAYKCPAGLDTIGYGNTWYPDGTKVKPGDVITQERANELLDIIVEDFAKKVKPLIKQNLTDNNFSALVLFAYNAGVTNLKNSTLLKKVNANPKDPSIRAEFMKWVRANEKVLNGLVKRREAEAKLYEQL
jgi:lysozyme